MTKNQIEYQKLLETRRANRAGEIITQARDMAARDAKIVELSEASRHNKALEGLQGRSLDETARHNLAGERVQQGQLSESIRHNKAGEQLGSDTLSETTRHNLGVEGYNTGRLVAEAGRLAEQVRHDLAMEKKDFRPVSYGGSTVVNLNPTDLLPGSPSRGPDNAPTMVSGTSHTDATARKGTSTSSVQSKVIDLDQPVQKYLDIDSAAIVGTHTASDVVGDIYNYVKKHKGDSTVVSSKSREKFK